jgi:streptogramin lyase
VKATPFKLRIFCVAALVSLAACSTAQLIAPSGARTQNAVILRRGVGSWQSFSVTGYPRGIVRVKNSDFWIADGDRTDTLSRLTPRGDVRYYHVGYSPLEIAVDRQRNFWLTLAGNLTHVVRVTPKLKVTSYSLTDDTSGGITLGRDGNIWVVENKHVGMITPTGTVTEYSTPQTEGSSGITWARDGLVWFQTTRGLASLDPRTGRVEAYRTPEALGGAIVATPDGTLWYTVEGRGLVTLEAFDPISKHFASYAAPSNFRPYGSPAGMVLAPDDKALWYATQRLAGHETKYVVGGGLVRFNLNSKRFTAFPAPDGYGWEWDLIPGANGTFWATAGASAQELHPLL